MMMLLHGVKCCIRLDGIVVLFTPELFVSCLVVRVRTQSRILCLLPRLYGLGLVVSESLLEEPCRYRRFVETSRRVDRRSTCATTAGGQQRRGVLVERALQIWFRSRVDGVQEWKTQEEKKRRKRTQQIRICSFTICRCRTF